MKSSESTKRKTNKDGNGKYAPYLEIPEVNANNDYPHDSRVLYTFFPKKSFGHLPDISSKNFIFLKTFNSEFSYTEVWFTDHICKRQWIF